ncbi:MAG: PEGA domain-containing protein [bacterium]|nr:PEGA domain-containing protein [bacterium]
MKKKLMLLFVLLLLFAGFIGVKYFILDSQNIYGRIKVVSSPAASVFIDSVAMGKTPYEERQKAGEYNLKLIPEGTATDTASWQGKIKITKNSLTYVNRELGLSDVTSAGEIFTIAKAELTKKSDAGEINIETEPIGAIIYLDNEEKGVAPVVLADIPKGDHELSVFMPNFFRRTQKINIDPGYRVNAVFKLAIDQSQKINNPSAPGTTTATPSASLEKKEKVTISDTPTGFLRVREEPTVNASESAQVKPGQSFDLVEEKEGWYKIEYEKGKEGWISGQYATK